MGYTAQIRIKRDGKLIYSQAETFARKQNATIWLRKREAELDISGAVDRAIAEKARPSGATLADAIDRYILESSNKIGRTKAQVLASIKQDAIADLTCSAVTSDEIIAFARRLRDGGRKVATVGNYMSHLSALFAIAKPAWKMDLDIGEMRAAQAVNKKMGFTGKSTKRTRRPTLAELDQLLTHFEARARLYPDAAPMVEIIAFALFSTRRQEEIVTITWADYERDHARVLVRDMKHPGQKLGNDIWCDLPPEAVAIIETRPRKDEGRIWPYTTDAISASFTRTCQVLAIEDLHFHDLRHEGVSRLFEMGRTIPQAASVSGHRSWSSLQRYAHLRQTGDKYAEWPWLDRICAGKPYEP